MNDSYDRSMQELVQRCLGGETEAFGDLYDLTIEDVKKTVLFLLEQKHDAEDVIHDIYLEAYRSLHRYDQCRPFAAWLKGVCIRQIQNYRRRNWHGLRLYERISARTALPGHLHWSKPVDDAVIYREMWEQVMTLPFKYRSVLILKYLFDYSQEDIAQILELPLGTIKSRLHYALRKAKVKISGIPLGIVKESKL